MSEIEFNAPFLLECTSQQYAWGRVGAESLVAQLLPDYDVSTPYAELWVGAHPKSPSLVRVGDELIALDQFIARFPQQLLGAALVERFGERLPFLFKILSVGAALSIQAHPDRALARKLHHSRPDHYPDENHKPELALALSDMELLYGFRNISQIAAEVLRIPELAALLGSELCAELSSCNHSADRELLRRVYAAVVSADSVRLAEEGARLLKRLLDQGAETATDQLVRKLGAIYGATDIGIFSCYLMNHSQLSAGEAIFIPANVPHAYLKGELVECMANSDNVVRAGLTPKYQDVETLKGMLTYESGPLQPLDSSVSAQNSGVREFLVPAAEFCLAELAGAARYEISSGGSVVLIFCLEGEAELRSAAGAIQLSRGRAALIPAALDHCTIHAQPATRLYRVRVPQ